MEKLAFFGTGPFVEESIESVKKAYSLSNIKDLRKIIEEKILKHASYAMRKRTSAEIIRRYLHYNDRTGEIEKTPLTKFANFNFPNDDKINVLYYKFMQVHPIVRITFERIRNINKIEFKKNDVVKIVSKLTDRNLDGYDKKLRTILYSLQEFKLITKNQNNKYIINQKNLSRPAFIFILYIHFLSQNSVAPKAKEIKEFFKEIYNQPDDYTEHCLLNFGEGFWVVERVAHLDQILFVYNNIDDFTKKFFEKFGN